MSEESVYELPEELRCHCFCGAVFDDEFVYNEHWLSEHSAAAVSTEPRGDTQ